MFIFDNVCNPLTLDSYKVKVETHYLKMLKKHKKPLEWYPTRNIRLKIDDPIVVYIQRFIQDKLRARFVCYDCEMQTWPVDSESPLHVHTMNEMGREHGDYNSLLYLNDDFEGGEFFTDTGIRIKPKKNRLTFFNGSAIPHGLTKVEKAHRYTIIFWWKGTRFV